MQSDSDNTDMIEAGSVCLIPIRFDHHAYVQSLYDVPAVTKFLTLADSDIAARVNWKGKAEIRVKKWLSECDHTTANGHFAITQGSAVIGYAGLDNNLPPQNVRDLTIVITPNGQGKGIGSEVVKALCLWAFSKTQLQCVRALVHPDNKSSIRVLEKSGFICAGSTPDELPIPIYLKPAPSGASSA